MGALVRERLIKPAQLILMGAWMCLSALASLPSHGHAQEVTSPPHRSTQPDLSQKQDELHQLEGTLRQSDAQRRALESDIEALRNDRARLANALIETAQKSRALESQIAVIEARLSQASQRADDMRHSLESRRDVIAQVLGALQRLGRNRPPAILVSPSDMLEAVRASMLLGAVVPQLRAQTEALAADLQELVRLESVQKDERARLAEQMMALARESERTKALVEARQAAITKGEQKIDDQKAQEKDLARQALDLRDLIARMENENKAAAQGAQAARQADLARSQAGEVAEGSPFRDGARLAPAIDFVKAKGLLPLPVAGTVLKTFGAPDGFGSTERGLTLSTRQGALVSSPSDGWVAFAGPWRSYGQLLIINVGGGYYIVLAGMQQINVELGQFVLAGEPVGVMSASGTKPVANGALGAASSVLYVEFRKDGVAIDPAPWWAKPELEKVRG
jgi:murein hydrolase activator